jgi:D-alanyl-D-alanine carboxypeptidase/D-alanyl-D-alanine-endopeptidase (penicillin-binding protein 4)
MTSCRNKQVKPVVKAPIPEVLHPSEKAAQDALTLELTEFVKDGCFSQASLGYIILDFTKGMPKLIAEHNSKQGLIPASTQKILTTGAALEIFGPPVYHEVTITNLNSINWRANRLLQKIGEKKYNKYDFIHGSRAVMEYWRDKGVDMKGMYICDGSGKSRDNTLSVKLLSDILFKMTTSPVFPVFYNSLPIAGLTGTMHKWLKGSDGQGRVHAKTGSLAGVRSYTGYVRTLTGKKLIFAFIVNNYSCRTPVFKKKMERVMVKMAEL